MTTEHGVPDARWKGRTRKLSCPPEETTPTRWDPRFDKSRLNNPCGRVYVKPQSKIIKHAPRAQHPPVPKPEKPTTPPFPTIVEVDERTHPSEVPDKGNGFNIGPAADLVGKAKVNPKAKVKSTGKKEGSES